MEHTVTLAVGYVDKTTGQAHTNVTFGRRLLGRDVFLAEESTDINAENSALLYRAAATKFGELSSVPMRAFLALDSLDLEMVDEGYTRFMQESLEGRAPEFIDDVTVRLPFGYVCEGITYDHVTFGNLTTGWDEVNAERRGYGSIARTCYLLGKEITRFSTADGSRVLDTPVAMSIFEALDLADILALKEASDKWQENLRAARAAELTRERAELIN